MPAILLDHLFDPWEELKRFQAANLVAGNFGATATFVGSMRDFNIDQNVHQMTLEHYPSMTQHYLTALCERCSKEFELDDCLIIHRFGDILPGEPIVLTAAWSAHRAAAFDACRFLMEELKARAPFWKKEITETGDRWVHNNLDSNKNKK